MKHMTVQEAGLADVYASIENSCIFGNKVRFKKRQSAQSEASRLNKTMPLKGPLVWCVAYRCEWCGHWHIGRPRKTVAP